MYVNWRYIQTSRSLLDNEDYNEFQNDYTYTRTFENLGIYISYVDIRTMSHLHSHIKYGYCSALHDLLIYYF